MDELAQWLENVGGAPRDWTDVLDADLAAEFERAWTEVLGVAPQLELLGVSIAGDAIRVSYSGGSVITENPGHESLAEHVADVARLLARLERENEWH